MKEISKLFFIIVLSLLGVTSAFAGHHPPPPNNGKKPPPPPGLSFDENIYILLILAVLLGIYVIYKYQFKPKNFNLN